MEGASMIAFDGVVQATLVFSLFGFPPGYLAGWLTDAFDFRRASLLRQFAISVPASVAVVPVLAFLPWRFASLQVVWGLFASSWILSVIVAAIGMRPRSENKAGWITGLV